MHRTVNEFLARYFVNRGQTSNRWEMMPNAVDAFYRNLSHWCIFMVNPATYGWNDNAGTIPPINVAIHRVELTDEQRKATRDTTGTLFVGSPYAASGSVRSWGRSPRGITTGRRSERISRTSSPVCATRSETNRQSSGASTTRSKRRFPRHSRDVRIFRATLRLRSGWNSSRRSS